MGLLFKLFEYRVGQLKKSTSVEHVGLIVLPVIEVGYIAVLDEMDGNSSHLTSI